jgi:hypothetical protein
MNKTVISEAKLLESRSRMLYGILVDHTDNNKNSCGKMNRPNFRISDLINSPLTLYLVPTQGPPKKDLENF